MDWFEKLTGFAEIGYHETCERLIVEGAKLRSKIHDASYGIGELELVALDELRSRAGTGDDAAGRMAVTVVRADVRALHRSVEVAGALFQVASQFNLLEMVGPGVTPEDGVTRYQHDHTQGPACAIAAGAATIYRNYFVPVHGRYGQTAKEQLDGLADLGHALGTALSVNVDELYTMRNGYALCSKRGLEKIAGYLSSIPAERLDALRGKLRIGLHRDVEVADAACPSRHSVSQAFCSAMPVAYLRNDASVNDWQPFATLVLEAAYEATILAGVLNAQRGVSNVVFLTLLGGGAFGNHNDWIYAALRRSLDIGSRFDLDIRLVSYTQPPQALINLAAEFGK